MNSPQLKINEGAESPTMQAVSRAAQVYEVTDERGRVITLKKPGPLAQYRIVDVMGNSSSNQAYMGMILPLIYIVAIDDQPLPQPTSKMQVEALITRLDEDGIDAVLKGVIAHFGTPDPEGDKNAIKN